MGLRELRKLHDGEIRQTEIFTATDWAGSREELWCFVVQHRVAKAEGGWEAWESDTRPAHFRRETDAIVRCRARETEMNMIGGPCRLGQAPLLEFRVAPKWLGYVPDADEKWIR